MKETGLMFKAPLVRAILEGRKTQTRRIVKRLPLRINRDANAMEIDVANIENGEFAKRVPCPMGQPGDRIYVRETWQHANFPLGPYQEGTPVFYRADYLHESDPDYADAERTVRRNWLPSIHMPKQAARIWLEITGVRVERLQDMSKADAVRDGGLHQLPATGRYVVNQGDQYFGMATHDPRELFQEIWESTGGDWAANPWVWVIDFKTISTTGHPACARSEA